MIMFDKFAKVLGLISMAKFEIFERTYLFERQNREF